MVLATYTWTANMSLTLLRAVRFCNSTLACQIKYLKCKDHQQCMSCRFTTSKAGGRQISLGKEEDQQSNKKRIRRRSSAFRSGSKHAEYTVTALEKDQNADDDMEFGSYSSESQTKMAKLLYTAGFDQPTADENSASPDDHYKRITVRSRALISKFEREIEKLVEKEQMTEALNLFDHKIKVDRIKPSAYIFSRLIYGFSLKQDMTKAFHLYNKMKKMGLKPVPPIMPSLFNICQKIEGNKSLAKAYSLLAWLQKNPDFMSDPFTLQAAARAFASHGDVQTALNLVDAYQKIPSVSAEDTLTLLLIVCLYQKNRTHGFYLLLRIMEVMRPRTRLNYSHYNLLLSCAYHCSTNNPKYLTEKLLTQNRDFTLHLPEAVNSVTNSDPASNSLLPAASCSDQLPTTCDSESSDYVIPDHPITRLILLGGVVGILEGMEADGCQPDLRIFQLLFACLPATKQSEEFLLTQMQRYKVELDERFYQRILLQRADTDRIEDCFEILEVMTAKGMTPYINTFNKFAVHCKNREECDALLKSLDKYKLNLRNVLKAMIVSVNPSSVDKLRFALEYIKEAEFDDLELLLLKAGDKIKQLMKIIAEQDKAWVQYNITGKIARAPQVQSDDLKECKRLWRELYSNFKSTC